MHSPPDYCVARVGPRAAHRDGSRHWLNVTALRACKSVTQPPRLGDRGIRGWEVTSCWLSVGVVGG